jgi:hypothetical protein
MHSLDKEEDGMHVLRGMKNIGLTLEVREGLLTQQGLDEELRHDPARVRGYGEPSEMMRPPSVSPGVGALHRAVHGKA